MNSKSFFLLFITLIFISSSVIAFSADIKCTKERFTTDKYGYVTGFKFRISNTSHDGSTITSISFFVVIYKFENGKKIYIGNELYVVDCSIRQGHYDTFEFNFSKDYGKKSELYWEYRCSFTSTKWSY